MKIEDLKTGMSVVTRDGVLYTVIKDCHIKGKTVDILHRGAMWMSLDAFNEDMTHKHYYSSSGLMSFEEEEKFSKDFDITEVYEADCEAAVGDLKFSKLIWRRENCSA